MISLQVFRMQKLATITNLVKIVSWVDEANIKLSYSFIWIINAEHIHSVNVESKRVNWKCQKNLFD